MRVLLVEDEQKMVEAVEFVLKENNYSVDSVFNGEDAYHYGLSNIYDVIILDIMLPKLSGLDVLRRLREKGIKTPIIMLSALGETHDRIEGLELGADDYLPKPFQSEELIARLKAITRRSQETYHDDLLEYGDIKLNPNTLELTSNNKSFTLTLKESQVLEYLIRNKNITVSKDMFMDKLWGYDESVNDNTVEVYISFLRKKLTNLNSTVSIETIRGVGYTLRDNEVVYV